MKTRQQTLIIAAAAAALSVAPMATAGVHTWDVNEVFSTPDGSIQFIELREAAGTPGEVNLAGNQVRSVSTGNIFTFPSNVAPPTSNRHILLATASFAALPGVPTPDHIISANFFNPNGDTIVFGAPYDSWTFGPVPTNCVNSLNRLTGVAPNTPTNYAGGTATGIDACPCPADVAGGDGQVNLQDLLFIIANWGGGAGNPADVNGDNTVNLQDLLFIIANWGAC